MTLPPVYEGTKSRAGTYRGVDMKSQTEIRHAEWMDHVGETWTYEPRYFGPAGDRRKPDWLVEMGAFRMYRETKPDKGDDWLVNHRGEVETWMRKIELVWLEFPGMTLAIVPWGHDWPPETAHPRVWLLNLHRGWRLIDDRNWPGPATVTPWEVV